jgi:hypothetical protein
MADSDAAELHRAELFIGLAEAARDCHAAGNIRFVALAEAHKILMEKSVTTGERDGAERRE